LKFIVKQSSLVPVDLSDNLIRLRVYKLENENWYEVEYEADASNIMNKMLEVAQNTIVQHSPVNNYLFVNVETPGLLLTLGEGRVESSETVISPKPSTLRSVKLYQITPEGRPVLAHEFKPMGEVFVYDGYISIPASIKYDFIVIETAEDLRPLFPSEIMLPPVKEVSKDKKRTRKSSRKRKAYASKKSGKTKKSKTSRKRKKAKRRTRK